MYLYIELWQPRSSWNELSREQREEFLAQVGPGIRSMSDTGVELVGFAVCDAQPPHGAHYRYMAIWKMPNLGHVHMLENAVRKEGWGNYFDIQDARGKLVPVDEALNDMMKL